MSCELREEAAADWPVQGQPTWGPAEAFDCGVRVGLCHFASMDKQACRTSVQIPLGRLTEDCQDSSWLATIHSLPPGRSQRQLSGDFRASVSSLRPAETVEKHPIFQMNGSPHCEAMNRILPAVSYTHLRAHETL